jgi:hypothetical protein
MASINTRFLMTASAVVMGAAGIAGSFMPHEILASLDTPATGSTPAIVQLLAALWLAWAMTNWMARGNAIGGIYSRPLAIGNFTHFAIGAVTLSKMVIAGGASATVTAGAILYAAFAIAFGLVIFGTGLPTASPGRSG